MNRERIVFNSEGELCVGYLHLPEGEGSCPTVLMGNGYATEWTFGTRDFINSFVGSGLAVFTFDYRCFGESEGEPRQLVDVQQQLADWRSALDLLESDRRVASVALWGSSLGGGHALAVGSGYHQAKAIVAQVPHCSSKAAFKTVTLPDVVRSMSRAIPDGLASLLGLGPITIPVVNKPGATGVMCHPGWLESYLSLKPEGSAWKNRIPARSLLRSGNYSPVDTVAGIQCPVLLVYGSEDAGVPPESVEETASKIADVHLEQYSGDHFEVYKGEHHKRIVKLETAFLLEHLAE